MPDPLTGGPYCGYCPPGRIHKAALLITAPEHAAHTCHTCAPRARRIAARHGPLTEKPLTPQEPDPTLF